MMSIPIHDDQSINMSLIKKLRNNLKPRGIAPIVMLNINSLGGMEVHSEFVSKCIDELERIPLMAELGELPSPLQKLAFMLLCDSAYIDFKK